MERNLQGNAFSSTAQREDKNDDGDDYGDDADDNEVLPVDRGWAWFVLAGSTMELMIIIGILKSSGILFVELQGRFNSTSGVTSLISTIQNAVFSICSLLVLNLGLRSFTCRTSLFLGGLVCCTSCIVTSRATSIELVMFSHGVLQGIGQAFIQPCTTVMVSRYFNKRRGFANSLAVSGGSIGGLMFAPILSALFEQYGFSGAFLITSGFYLNTWVVGALYRPDGFYESLRQRRQGNTRSAIDKQYWSVQKDNSGGVLLDASDQKDQVKSFEEKCLEIDENLATELPLIVHESEKRLRAVSQDSVETPGNSEKEVDVMTNPQLECGQKIQENQDNAKSKNITSSSEQSANLIPTKAKGHQSHNTGKKRNRILQGVRTMFSLLDIRLFKRPVFVMFVTSAGLLCSSCSLLSVYLAPHVKERGVDLRDTAVLLTITAALDFVSRSMSGVIADKKLFRTSSFIGLVTIILGFIVNLLRFMDGFASFAVFSVCIGLLGGVYFALFPLVIVDYMTINKLQSCLGFTTLFHGGSAAATFALVGILRDATGSYIVPFHFLGVQMISGGALMMLLPVAAKSRTTTSTAKR